MVFASGFDVELYDCIGVREDGHDHHPLHMVLIHFIELLNHVQQCLK